MDAFSSEILRVQMKVQTSPNMFDGRVIINMLVPTNCKNFLQHAIEVFIPYIRSQTVNIQRIDVLSDHYFQESLKSETRNVSSNEKIPKNWRVNCFHFINSIKILVATDNEIIVSNHDDIMHCNIEEADERLLLHISDVLKSFDQVLIKTADSDVAIIATAAFREKSFYKKVMDRVWQREIHLFQFMGLCHI